ncbi:cephalosporin-C deacetylase [Demequina sediminis]|uniref:Cephalosporin-C deacetylase n=1 Tax=Demequina sediminis TaxID=1930058 RepID=A0ABP9WF96_9MICO|nr:acetylxylan esterase [Demequina sediminis]BDZ61001.1 acetylxylan esterase [Demequina sediminis]
MPFSDMSREALESYRPDLPAPADFDERWTATLAEARAAGGEVAVTPVDAGLALIEASDVTFPGFGGDPVRAWWLRPRGLTATAPVVVEFNGYGGGRGLVHERLLWAAAGYHYVFMDTRGQGSAWGNGGDTADASGGGDAGAPALPGFMTRGVREVETYYFRRLLTDAARCVDAVRTLPGIDPTRVVVAGASQGGGLAIAAAGLVPDVAGALVDVPFLCHIERGVRVAEHDPYQEIARYLAVHRDREEETFRTLAYVDGVHHAARAQAPALFSVALRDDVCPPSTVYAAYHAWAGPAQMVVYPYNGHEGGQAYQQRRQLTFLDHLWENR